MAEQRSFSAKHLVVLVWLIEKWSRAVLFLFRFNDKERIEPLAEEVEEVLAVLGAVVEGIW